MRNGRNYEISRKARIKYLPRRFNKDILYPGNKGKIDETLSFLLGINIYDGRPPDSPQDDKRVFSVFSSSSSFSIPSLFYPFYSRGFFPRIPLLLRRRFLCPLRIGGGNRPTDPPIPKFGKRKRDENDFFALFQLASIFLRGILFFLFPFFGNMVKVRNETGN